MALYTHTYTHASDILAEVNREIALAADNAFTENGSPLYDQIVLTSKDNDWVTHLIGDSLARLAARTADICAWNTTTNNLTFTVPDIPTGLPDLVDDAITRYAALYACMCVLNVRYPALSQDYAQRCQSAMDNVIALVRQRKRPAAATSSTSTSTTTE